MQERDWARVDLKTLRDTFQREMVSLERALLEGADWKDLREQRITITRLSREIHRKTESSRPAGPADRSVRKDHRMQGPKR